MISISTLPWHEAESTGSNMHIRLLKLADKRTGWYGEGCWRARGRRFIKRLEHRYNRRYNKWLTKQEQHEQTSSSIEAD